MFAVDDHVTRKGTNNPIGIVEAINASVVTVRWGVDLRRSSIKDDIDEDGLEKVPYPVFSPDEVNLKQLEVVHDYMGDVHSENWYRSIIRIDPELEEVIETLRKEMSGTPAPLGGKISMRLILRQLAKEAGRL